MQPKDKSTKKTKRIETFSLINPHAAGIDIGDTEICVAVGPDKCEENVRTYRTFTSDLGQIVEFLKACLITHVAMEATGVYWVQLYLLLEKEGFVMTLANPKFIKNVTGRKDDENDAMWIQRLHVYGLIRGSFQPDWPTRELRELMRHRERLVREKSKAINRIIKALVLMNIKVQTVISDIDGKSGKAIIEAIVNGERDAVKLAELAHPRIKASKETLIKSLEGNWNAHQLFIIMQLYSQQKFLAEQIKETDLKVEEQLKVLIASRNEGELPAIDLKQERKRAVVKNDLPFNATAYLNVLLGTKVTEIPGINELTALKFLSETGPDMSKWSEAKNFRAWLNAVPTTEKSGGKILSARIKKRFHRGRQALLIAAGGVRRTKTPLGDIFRKQQYRGGPKKARNAVVETMATSWYMMVRHKIPYQPDKLIQNQEKQKQDEIKRLERRLTKLKAAA